MRQIGCVERRRPQGWWRRPTPTAKAGRGYSRVASEVLDKTWYEGKDDLGYPLVHLLVRSGIEERDPAAV